MTLSAVILAGGKSRRMGRDKAFIELERRTLLERQVAIAREAGAAEVFISGRPGVRYPDCGAPVLEDAVAGEGPVSGIIAGLGRAWGTHVLVLAVDLPRMTAEFLRGLAGECGPGTGVVSESSRGIEPLAAIYPREARALAEGFFERGGRAAGDLAREAVAAGLLRKKRLDGAEEAMLENWNEPGDAGRI